MEGWWRMEELLGQTVIEIKINADKDRIIFKTKDSMVIYDAEGDCCSHSWIEHISNVPAMLNSPITDVQEISMPDCEQPEYDVIQPYGIQITTDKGQTTIEYRNESNGYYGGYMEYLSSSPTYTKYHEPDMRIIEDDF